MQLKLIPYLQQGVLDNIPTERYMTALRSDLLEKVARGEAVPLDLLAALAGFCHASEYVMWEAPDDTARLEKLDPARSETERLMTGCFRPVAPERLPRDEIEPLRPLSDETSKAVGAQYEENPYPRWRFLPPTTPRDDAIDILVAGAGTGQEPILVAKEYPKARVTALDLSRTSLAYGLMRAREHDAGNIRFLQGDILDVAMIGQKFDSIRSSGVLHHMKEPLQGLLALKGVLKHSGTIRLFLYSAAARWGTLAAQEMRKARGIPATPDAIRAFRQEILALPDDHPAKTVSQGRDFFSISGVRDLLFHVQEHNYTIPMIADLVAASGLRLLEFANTAKARKRFEDMGFKEPNDLASWEKVEALHPGTFSGMYKFTLGF
ncbi:MAG: class I SAM-dependent methyltransferase [Rhodospirillaceae bacterium]|nr:class I SAM-dependent methyltransferase [Rhodospirillaceae bacterium]